MGGLFSRPCPTASVVSTSFSHPLCSRGLRVSLYGFRLPLSLHQAGGSHSKSSLFFRLASSPAGSSPSSMCVLHRFRRLKRSEAELVSSIVWSRSREFVFSSISRKCSHLFRSMAGEPVAGLLPGRGSHAYIGMILFAGITILAGSLMVLRTRLHIEPRFLARV